MRWFVVVAAMACGRLRFDVLGTESDGSIDVVPSDTLDSDTPNPVMELYGMTYTNLYRVDRSTFIATDLGTLCPNIGSLPTLAEIVFESDGSLIITGQSNRIFRASFPDLTCIEIAASLSASYLGLAHVPAGVAGPAETLLGATNSNMLYRLDTTTGTDMVVGPLAGAASCGLAWTGTDLLITLIGTGGDDLARVDPMTGGTTVIGNLGANVWGLAWIDARLLGLTSGGTILEIDPADASTILVGTGGPTPWSGAAVFR